MYHVINLETGIGRLAEGNEPLDTRYPNLYVSEFACNDGCEIVPYDPRVPELFQRVRNIFGPLSCNSGFRTVSHNAKEGGASDSQHLYGKAIDIATPDGVDDELFYGLIMELAEYQGGFGIYNGRVHYDCRDVDDEPVLWDNR